MNSLPIPPIVHIPCNAVPATAGGMPLSRVSRSCAHKQWGVVLFFTLIALLAMSLAAVALIRSVDTGAMITGNLSFQHSATTSADAGVEAAMGWLRATTVANAGIDVFANPAHPLNQTNLAVNPGYFSSLNPALNLKDAGTWSGVNASPPIVDQSGNTTRYIIERMCRFANVPIQVADCLYNSVSANNNFMSTPTLKGLKPPGGQPPQVRITVQTVGANGTVSYVLGFVF
ncbi:MAG: hypothetical protein Q7U91_14775 [Sideroxyarcus sp.]|nr:hypothetical protein [Sideroxyarcus sp.]